MGKGVVECEKDSTSNRAFCIGQITGIRASEIEALTRIRNRKPIYSLFIMGMQRVCAERMERLEP